MTDARITAALIELASAPPTDFDIPTGFDPEQEQAILARLTMERLLDAAETVVASFGLSLSEFLAATARN